MIKRSDIALSCCSQSSTQLVSFFFLKEEEQVGGGGSLRARVVQWEKHLIAS